MRDLPNKWRMEDPDQHLAPMGVCADELEAALPVWTKITDDPDTWPEDGMYLWVYGDLNGAWIHATYDVAMMRTIADMVQHTCWRPLCSIDYPPEQNQ